jgi:hypothetical protein
MKHSSNYKLNTQLLYSKKDKLLSIKENSKGLYHYYCKID